MHGAEAVVPATPDRPALATESTHPYQYGLRYVFHRLSDGDEVYSYAPLTIEDVLHPQIGDYAVTNDYHHQVCVYLYNVLRARLMADPTAVVFSNVLIFWNLPEIKQHAPDIAVITGVREQRLWESFSVTEEGVRPQLIIEITSPSTRRLELYDKLIEYDLAGVPSYIIVDIARRKGELVVRLFGYKQSTGGYSVLLPNEAGWLWMEAVGLWIGVEGTASYAMIPMAKRRKIIPRLRLHGPLPRPALLRLKSGYAR